jgi:hypothetical protein
MTKTLSSKDEENFKGNPGTPKNNDTAFCMVGVDTRDHEEHLG